MPKVSCATLECKYNDDYKCKADHIELAWSSVVTVNDGRKEYQRCKQYEMSGRAKRFIQLLNNTLAQDCGNGGKHEQT